MTAWCNRVLKNTGKKVDNIFEDFRGGRLLLVMLETLTRRKVGEADRGNMRLHKISNVLKAFSFIESIGIRHQMAAEGNSLNSLHFLIFHFYQMFFFLQSADI